MQDSESVIYKDLYRGELEFDETTQDVDIMDARFYLGAGGKFNITNDLTLNSNLDLIGSDIYFEKENTWEMDNNFSYYISGGLYWLNGVKIEFEYSEMLLETSNYGQNFRRYVGSGPGNGEIFNQYLQVGHEIFNNELRDNVLPLAELSLRTYMVNFIFEKVTAKHKVKPYFGFGVGMATGDITTLVNEGASSAVAAQVLVGLSYPFIENMSIYLGYRGLYVGELEQTFTRVVSANDFDGSTYYNPTFEQSTEKYDIPVNHSVSLGFKFFF